MILSGEKIKSRELYGYSMLDVTNSLIDRTTY